MHKIGSFLSKSGLAIHSFFNFALETTIRMSKSMEIWDEILAQAKVASNAVADLIFCETFLHWAAATLKVLGEFQNEKF